MYESYWGLNTRVFENTPDPDFFYPSSQHEEALGRLIYVVEGGKGAALLTGVFGCGKTLIGRALLRQLDPSIYKVVVINNPRMTDIELLMAISSKLGKGEFPQSKSEVLKNTVLSSIEGLLSNNHRDGRKTVIIVDEAHSIQHAEIFEELRLLLNFQNEEQFLLTLLFFGQPELKELIQTNKQLVQRIAIGYHLQPLGVEDTAKYVRHRLEKGRGNTKIFTDEALAVVHSYSGGIPRRINQICDISLLTGMEMKAQRLTPEIVKAGVNTLGL